MRKFVNRFLTAFLLIAALLVSGCKHGRVDSEVSGHSPPYLDSCDFEPSHHYYITLPNVYAGDQNFPLVIVLDPHGDGLLAVQKFRDALEDLPVAVAGSLMLRNNYRYFELSLNRLYSDLLEKYPVERTKVIVAGFSGGARMALEYGLKYPVRGIVMFGAGPVQLRGGPQGKWIYAVSGTEDFNFGGQFRLRERLFQGRSRMAT